ncbi:HAD family hydrolase [Candidatus Omnitrophota bacterium]
MLRVKRFKHKILAIVYDFDGTLTPQPMQEYTVLPQIGITGRRFWGRVRREKVKTYSDEIATYMRLMIEQCHRREFPLTSAVLSSLAENIRYYRGVRNYFTRINRYVARKTKGRIILRHYIISSGLKEIIEKTTIYRHFYNIFASEYHYDEYGKPDFIKNLINDTMKTQYIFRINKGIENLNKSINNYMPEQKRKIPFQNIIYIGDGITDVPCMTVTKKNGGSAIAVHKGTTESLRTCTQLLSAERVDFIAKADYNEGSELDRIIKLLLEMKFQGIYYGRQSVTQYNKYIRRYLPEALRREQ